MSSDPSSGPTSPFNPYLAPNITDMPVGMADPRSRQSGFGIASFVMALLGGGGIVAEFGLITVLAMARPELIREYPWIGPVAGMVMLGCLGLCALGAAFGLAGLFQRDRARTLSVLGLVLNSLVVLAFVGLVILGMVMNTARVTEVHRRAAATMSSPGCLGGRVLLASLVQDR